MRRRYATGLRPIVFIGAPFPLLRIQRRDRLGIYRSVALGVAQFDLEGQGFAVGYERRGDNRSDAELDGVNLVALSEAW